MSEVYMVKSPLTLNNSIIFGRNSFSSCCKEVLYFQAKSEGTVKCANIKVSPEASLAYIVNGTCGSNEKNVSISTVFVENKSDNSLTAYDIIRLALERSDNAENAVDIIIKLTDQYNIEENNSQFLPKFSFFICDMNDVYILDIVGNMCAAEKIDDTFRAFGKGFSVQTKIDKKSDRLEDKLKELGLFDGNGDLNFCEIFSLPIAKLQWSCEEPSQFSAQNMFEVLRASSKSSNQYVSSSFVAVLKESVSVHWITATPNPLESVFKPFIFTSNARISPLTAFESSDDSETPLRKLHSNRNWDHVGQLLKSLEKSCVDEIDRFVDDAPFPELDELLKDCIEAEVKFYR